MKPYPAYKDSGVAWIGEVPEHWNNAKMRWISEIYAGGTPSKDVSAYWVNGTIPWLSSGEVNQEYVTEPTTYISDDGFKNSSAKWIPKDALVIALAGQGKTKGMVAQLGIETTCNQSLAAIVPKRLQPRYVYYWLKSNYKNIRGLVGDGQRDGLNLDILGSIPVPILPEAEQTAIAAYLDRKTAQIDTLIERKRRLIQLRQEERTAAISHAVTKGLNPAAPMKDSGVEWIGEVPKHWDIDRLKWSVILCKNGIWGNEPDGENDLICVRVADFDRHTALVVLNEPTMRSIKPNERNNRVLTKGDLLLEKSGGGEQQPVGFVVLYDYDQEAVCSNFVARMPVVEGFNSKYWNYLHSYLYSVRVNTRSIKQTTGIQNLDSYFYLSERVGVPPPTEQTAIAAYLDEKTAQIDQTIARTERQIELLQEYRTALISAAVTGKIDVRQEIPA